MRALRIPVVTAVLLIAVACGVSAEKITVDPNAQGRQEQARLPTDDVRLQQKITYTARHKALKVILADLSKMTGGTLKAGYNNNDWQVRDRKMNIFAKDVPLAALMNSIARVMKFKWKKRDEVDPPQYRLYMDRKSLLAANAAKSRAEEQFTRYATGKRREFVDYIINAEDPSPAELDALKEEQPYLYLMHQRGTVKLLRALFDQVPGFTETFIAGSYNLTPPATILSPETRQMLLHTAQEQWKTDHGDFRAGADEPFPQIVLDRIDSGVLVRLDFMMRPSYNQFDNRDWSFGGMGLMTPDDQWVRLGHFRDPSSPIANEQARQEIMYMETSDDWEKVHKERSPVMRELYDRMQQEKKKLFPCEPTPEHPDEPDLHRKVTLKETAKSRESASIVHSGRERFADLLQSLCEASGFAVVSDSFSVTEGGVDVYGSEKELKDFLDAIAEACAYNWQKHDGVLEFQDKYWFRKRTSQIPDEWMDGWWASLKSNGLFTLDDLAQMSALTREQIEESLAPDERFLAIPNRSQRPYGLFWSLTHYMDAFRFYRSLVPNQRAMFLSDDGLNVDFLTMPQYELAKYIFNPREDPEWGLEAMWEGPNPPARLRAKLGQKSDGFTRYVLEAYSSDGRRVKTRHVTTVTYDQITDLEKLQSGGAKP